METPASANEDFDLYVRQHTDRYGIPPLAGAAGPALDEEEETEEETEVSDDEVKDWLNQLVKTPEIQSIIKASAKELAEASTGQAVTKVREELQADFDKKLDDIKSELAAGRITKTEAKEQVRDAAEEVTDDRLAAELAKRDAAAAELDKERKQKRRELNIALKEALLAEDQNTLVKETLVITDETDEDTIPEMIEASKKAYARIRRAVLRELREQNMLRPSPRSAQRENEEEEVEDDEHEDEPPARQPRPATRDRQTAGLTKQRKESLRDRFRYGPKSAA